MCKEVIKDVTLSDKLKEVKAAQEKYVNKTFRHFKGNTYVVTDVVLNADTLEPMVVYSNAVGCRMLWVRPLKEFAGNISDKRAKLYGQKQRFKQLT